MRTHWLVDGLMAAGYDVRLANTVAMKRYDGLKRSDDETDGAHLAHLLRLGILPTGYIHPPAERALRDLARKRVQLVRSRTSRCWRWRTFWPGRPVRVRLPRPSSALPPAQASQHWGLDASQVV